MSVQQQIVIIGPVLFIATAYIPCCTMYTYYNVQQPRAPSDQECGCMHAHVFIATDYVLHVHVRQPTAPSDQECGGSGRAQGLRVHRVLQAAAREAGHRRHREPAHRALAAADGAHQGDDGRDAGGEGRGRAQARVLGAHQEGPLPRRHRSGLLHVPYISSSKKKKVNKKKVSILLSSTE